MKRENKIKQEDTMSTNVYVSKSISSKHVQKKFKKLLDKLILVVEDFNIGMSETEISIVKNKKFYKFSE